MPKLAITKEPGARHQLPNPLVACWALLLHASCTTTSEPTVSDAEWVSRLWQAQCEGILTCSWGEFVAQWNGVCGRVDALNRPLPAAYIVDAVAAAQCEADLRTCVWALSDRNSDACTSAIRGTLPLGTYGCSYWSCAEGTCADLGSGASSGCATRCQLLGGQGAPCVSDSACAQAFACINHACLPVRSGGTGNTCVPSSVDDAIQPCQPSLYCAPQSKTCVPRLGEHEACDGYRACLDGLSCVEGTCALTLPAGASCTTAADGGVQTTPCEPGTVCEPNAAGATCIRRPAGAPDGATCTSSKGCRSGWCRHDAGVDVCGAPPEAKQPATVDGLCPPYLHNAYGRCQPNEVGVTCEPGRLPFCNDRLYCDGLCRKQVGLNALCSDNHMCAEPYVCGSAGVCESMRCGP